FSRESLRHGNLCIPLISRALITSIATQYEENKARRSSLRKQGPITTGANCHKGNSLHRPADGTRRMRPCFRRDDTGKKKGPGRNRGPFDCGKQARLLVGALLERGAENVAE